MMKLTVMVTLILLLQSCTLNKDFPQANIRHFKCVYADKIPEYAHSKYMYKWYDRQYGVTYIVYSDKPYEGVEVGTVMSALIRK